MIAREKLNQLKEKFGPAIQRADLPGDRRLFVFVEPPALKAVCQYVFRDLDARYVISIGADDRPFSGTFLVAHDFAFDRGPPAVQRPGPLAGGRSQDRQHLRRGARGELGRARNARPGRHRAGRAIPIPSAWSCRTAGRRACTRCAKTLPGITCRRLRRRARIQVRRPAGGLHGRAVRPVPSHAR